jgi:phosphate uptake regulator
MHVRKLQRLGTTTIVVSLPRKWVKERGLKQGDVVYIEEGIDSITLHTSDKAKQSLRVTINAEMEPNPESLARLVTASYLQGYDEVRVVSQSGLLQEQIDEILAAVERLPGFEVLEQTSNWLTIQGIVDPARFTVDSIIKRMQVMISAMISASIDAVIEGMPEKAAEVSRVETKVDELYFLVVRQLLLSIRNPSLARVIGIDSVPAVTGYRMVSKSLEEIGDYALAISRESLNIKRRGRSIDREILTQIMTIGEEVSTIFGRAVNAFLTLDFKLISSVFQEIPALSEKIVKLEAELLEKIKDPQSLISFRLVLRYISEMLDQCRIIAEVAVNKFVRIDSKICVTEVL